MDYQELKFKIEDKILTLAKDIEKFCTVENKDYTTYYKNQLWEIHRLFEDLI